jgi:hypothetical protein
MSKGVQRTWEIILKLIPKIYDTQRQLRILGPDDSETYLKVNEVVQDPTVPGDADGERHHARRSST